MNITVDVDVSEEDIRAGIPEEPDACPLAHAIRRQLHPDSEVLVDSCIMGPLGGHAIATIDGTDCVLPDECGVFIDDFDHGGPVFPFKFQFKVPV